MPSGAVICLGQRNLARGSALNIASPTVASTFALVEVLRAPPPTGLLVADEREHHLGAPGIRGTPPG